MNATPAALGAMKSSTHCRLCGERWTKVKTNLLLNDQLRNEELVRLIQSICQHMETAHPDVMASLKLAVQEFSGCMMLANFGTDDGRLDEEMKRYLANVKLTIGNLETKIQASAVIGKRTS